MKNFTIIKKDTKFYHDRIWDILECIDFCDWTVDNNICKIDDENNCNHQCMNAFISFLQRREIKNA